MSAPRCTVAWGACTLRVYLLEDRIEVGRTSAAYSEEMNRVSYRDAAGLVTWRSARPRFLFLGALFVVAAVSLAVAVVLGGPVGLVALALLPAAPGVFFLVRGRPGSVLQFRVEGTRGSVHGVVAGSLEKQNRFLAELTERIRSRQGQPSAPGAA